MGTALGLLSYWPPKVSSYCPHLLPTRVASLPAPTGGPAHETPLVPKLCSSPCEALTGDL